MKKHARGFLWSGIILFPVTLILLSVLQSQILPDIFSAQYSNARNENVAFTMPLLLKDQVASEYDIRVDMKLSTLHPSLFKIAADDCVKGITVNGSELPEVQFCDIKGKIVNLNPYLKPGTNIIQATLEDRGGWVVFKMKAARSDPFVLIINILLGIVFALFAFFLLKYAKAKPYVFGLCSIAMFGAALAKIYDVNLLFGHLAYDNTVYLDYMQYIAEFLKLPSASEIALRGWELYQTPLYYILAALWMTTAEGLGRAQGMILQDVYTISWFFMTAALFVNVWIATMLFSDKKRHTDSMILVALVSLLPGIIFLSSSITSDPLMYLVATLFFAFFLRWWQHDHPRDLYVAWMFAFIALITKTSAPVLIFILLAALFCNRQTNLPEHAKKGLSTLILVTIFLVWFQFLRDGTSFVISMFQYSRLPSGNAHDIFVGPWHAFSGFFNISWNAVLHIESFWGQLGHTALFGDFPTNAELNSISFLMLVLGRILVLLAVYGLVQDLRHKRHDTLPMFLMAFGFVCGVIFYRSYLFSPQHDFRFLAPAALCIAYYAIQGKSYLPERLQTAAQTVFFLFLASCIAFMYVLN